MSPTKKRSKIERMILALPDSLCERGKKLSARKHRGRRLQQAWLAASAYEIRNICEALEVPAPLGYRCYCGLPKCWQLADEMTADLIRTKLSRIPAVVKRAYAKA